MKVLLEEKRKIILALLMGAALLFFAVIMYNTYDAYTNMVVEPQQQHLLLISRAVAQNMELYISDSAGHPQRDPDPRFSGIHGVLLHRGRDGPDEGIYLFLYAVPPAGPGADLCAGPVWSGNFPLQPISLQRGAGRGRLGPGESARKRESGIGTVFPIDEERCGMTLVTNVYGGNGYLGTVISVMDLDVLYKRICGQLKFPGSGRYCGEGWEREYYQAPGFPDAAIQF